MFVYFGDPDYFDRHVKPLVSAYKREDKVQVSKATKQRERADSLFASCILTYSIVAGRSTTNYYRTQV